MNDHTQEKLIEMLGKINDSIQELRNDLQPKDAQPEEPKIAQAFKVPLDDCGFTIKTGRDGTWLGFSASDKTHAMFNVECMAAKERSSFGATLATWCTDRQKQRAEAEKKSC